MHRQPTLTIVLTASLALSSSLAMAGNRTLDPCPVPGPVATEALTARFNELSKEEQRIEADSDAFDQRCASTKDKSAADRECAASLERILARISANDGKTRDYHRSLVAAFDERLAKIDARMAETRRRMDAEIQSSRDMHRDAEEWIEKGEHAKLVARLSTAFEIMEILGHGMTHHAEHGVTLAENQIVRMRDWYARYAQSMPASARAPIEKQIAGLRTVGDIGRLIQQLGSTGSRSLGMIHAGQEGHDLEFWLHFFLGAIRTAVTIAGYAKIQIAAAAMQMLVDDAYAYATWYYARTNIDLLLAAQDKSLQAVTALGNLYVADVRSRKALSQAKASLVASACYLEKKK